MTARVWPADSVDTNADGIPDTPSLSGRMLRQTLVAASAAMSTNARPLGAVSGVRPGTPTSIVTATSTTWTVTPFMGVIDGEAAAIAGAYEYAFDANVTGSVTAAGASLRTDRLDVQISDHAEADGTGATTPPFPAIIYTAGTPGLAAAPARSHPLAQISVPASGGGSPTVSWTASYFAPPGAVLPFNTVAGLQAWTPPMDGQPAYAYDTDNLWLYMAGAPTPGWYQVAGRTTAGVITYSTVGATYSSSGTSPSSVTISNGRVYLNGAFTTSAATFAAATTYTIGQITTTSMQPAAPQKYTGTWGGTGLVSINVATDGTITVLFTTAPGSVGAGALQVYLSGMSWPLKGL